MKKRGAINIGTSGWMYKDWGDMFYPPDLPDIKKLPFLAQHFPTVEINSTFYHLPKLTTFVAWHKRTPDNFIFSVKVSRYLSHQLRLKAPMRPWQRFIKGALLLKEKLGPLLIQFPPSFKANTENIKRFNYFFTKVRNKNPSLRIACEVRHASWLNEKCYDLFRKYRLAWVVADSSRYAQDILTTTDFVYMRFHGPEQLFSSRYTKKRLTQAAAQIHKWSQQGLDVFVYFNNDRYGHALHDARTLTKLVKSYKAFGNSSNEVV